MHGENVRRVWTIQMAILKGKLTEYGEISPVCFKSGIGSVVRFVFNSAQYFGHEFWRHINCYFGDFPTPTQNESIFRWFFFCCCRENTYQVICVCKHITVGKKEITLIIIRIFQWTFQCLRLNLRSEIHKMMGASTNSTTFGRHRMKCRTGIVNKNWQEP